MSTSTDVSRADDFQPRRWLRNGHLQTIFGNFLRRTHTLPAPTAELIDVKPDTKILCDCHWQSDPEAHEKPTAIILHGLEGSSNSQYVAGNAAKLWAAGCNVVRMNMRNCGGTEALTPTLYHSGLSSDLDAVMRHYITARNLTWVTLIGYSMGGNIVLKLAGELGSDAPAQLRSVVGVSPAIDLGPSADALHELQNRLYERRFVRNLLNRYTRKLALFPTLYDPARARNIHSVRDFDEHITGPYSGFRDANDYYFRASAARVIDRIAIPSLVLHAKDDPFVHITAESNAKLHANPHVSLLEPDHGGHCAFLADPDTATNNDGYWAEHTLLRFILANP